MSISAPFIRRPIATSLLAAAILLAGLLAYSLLPVAPLPNVDFPTIQVTTNLPGASPETMASSVATPLERRFGRIAGITEITSTSTLGTTSLTLQFDLNRDVEGAARDVQAAIAAAGGELPPNLPFRPTYRKVNPADSPIMILSLTSPTIPLAQVFDSANTILAQKISQVRGVGQVTVGGGQQPAVRVRVDPLALAGMGLSLEDVRAVLSTSTADQPKGTLTGPSQTQSIAANDQLFGAASYADLVLTYNNGSAVRLKDVADVFDDVENQRVAAWINGVRSVLIIVRRQPGANIIETNDRVRALLPSLETSIPKAIDLQVALESHADHPRLRPRCRDNPSHQRGLGRPRRLRLSANLARDSDPEHRSSPVARRYIWSDVPSRLQLGQPFLDGAHHFDGLRRRRRHRRHGEHRSLRRAR